MRQLYDTGRGLNEGEATLARQALVGMPAQPASNTSRYAPRMQWFDAAADP